MMTVLRNAVYYRIKPLMPRPLRLAVRRWLALRKRPHVREFWPIMPGSEQAPEGWPGWPEGKKFALVLTHDVEGPLGLNRCHALMELEKELGFRSSFNFIPEGEYSLPVDLREEVVGQGFEVGVHDLKHDGRLYRSRADFRRNAQQINAYLKQWGATGFRSGFMLHNLDWLHELNIQYDASTFDIDPFEPQPQGRKTIFPFWVARPAEEVQSPKSKVQSSTTLLGNGLSGYVELPYTLPQDSTLFLLLGERHPDIWFQKLDWISSHGGMALVNVHPDYLRLDGEPPSPRTYPVEFYVRFLNYARKRYGQEVWCPLPREVAAFVAERRLPPRRKPKRICMVTYSHFLQDARVTRYAESLAQRGDQVDVVALRRTKNVPTRDTIANINIVRLQPRFGKKESSRLAYLVPVLRFLAASSFWIARQHVRQPYDVLHIHNVPDFLVFAGWYPKLRGTKLVLDIHDIVPEFYASKFSAPDNAPAIRLLKWAERVSAHFADHVIISNHLWREKYAARTQANGKCSVFINNVDVKIFQPRARTRQDNKLIVLFPGGLQWHQGLDIAIRAFREVSARLPQAEFHIYGDGNMKNELIALTAALGLEQKVRFFNPVPVREVAEIMANADLGVVPKRADSFGNEAYSTKIMEFLSLGVPVVVSSTKIDRYYFDDSVVRFFESGNETALAKAILEVLQDPELRRRLIDNARPYVARNSWETRRQEYLGLIDSLANGKDRE